MQGVVEGSGARDVAGVEYRRKRCSHGWRYCNAGRGCCHVNPQLPQPLLEEEIAAQSDAAICSGGWENVSGINVAAHSAG